MVHEVDPKTFVISEGDCWRPGSFTSRDAAEVAESLPDATIEALTKCCEGGQIDLETLQVTCFKDAAKSSVEIIDNSNGTWSLMINGTEAYTGSRDECELAKDHSAIVASWMPEE